MLRDVVWNKYISERFKDKFVFCHFHRACLSKNRCIQIDLIALTSRYDEKPFRTGFIICNEPVETLEFSLNMLIAFVCCHLFKSGVKGNLQIDPKIV